MRILAIIGLVCWLLPNLVSGIFGLSAGTLLFAVPFSLALLGIMIVFVVKS